MTWSRDGSSETKVLLDLQNRVASPNENWKWGMYSMAFRPVYSSDPRIFVFYSEPYAAAANINVAIAQNPAAVKAASSPVYIM